MNWSVEYAAILSPADSATALHGSCDLKVNRSLPEATSHSFTDESADAVISFSESPANSVKNEVCNSLPDFSTECEDHNMKYKVLQVMSHVQTAPLCPL